MSDILELSDADFTQKMEGLVDEAKRALEGHTPKGDKEKESAAPAPAAPPPAEAARATVNLPEMLRPLVQGVQAVGRAAGEHTQILARMERAAQEASQAHSELPQLVTELRGVMEQRNQVSRQMFDALYEELKTYKDGFLLDSLHRPMIRDLITLYDDMALIHRQATEVAGGCAALPEGTSHDLPKRTASVAMHLDHNLQFILEVLARLEVQRLPTGAGKLDKRTQRAMSVEIAEDPDQDMDVVRSLKCGFLWKDRVFRAEEVVVRKWKEGFLVALQNPNA